MERRAGKLSSVDSVVLASVNGHLISWLSSVFVMVEDLRSRLSGISLVIFFSARSSWL